jgi:PAS domain S-box-containing protein
MGERVEETQDTSDARLRVLIEVAPDGIFVTRDGVILYVNPAGARMLGAPDPADVVNTRLAEVLSPRDLAAGSVRLASVAPDRVLPTRVYDVIGRGGRTLTVEATSIAIEWEGAPAGLTFGRDITERLRLESALARTDRLTALGLLAAGVAHEISNPLACVSLGFDELSQLATGVAEPTRTTMASLILELRAGLARVASITDDLRTFARDRVDGSGGRADVATVLATVQRLVAHRLKHCATITIDVPPELALVRLTPQRLEQVLVNLLVNAGEAFDAGHRTGTIRIRATGDASRVTIEVADDGDGIPPAVLERVFEPFFTTKGATTGTGLGLAITHSIVTDAGGELTVESEVGRGTTFRIVVPTA